VRSYFIIYFFVHFIVVLTIGAQIEESSRVIALLDIHVKGSLSCGLMPLIVYQFSVLQDLHFGPRLANLERLLAFTERPNLTYK
jgi:hypothetical protein